MKLKRLRELSLRAQLMLVTALLVVLTTVLLTTITYCRQKRALLESIDRQLMVAAQLARAIPPEGYFGGIVDSNSVSRAQYEHIVDRHNRLCLELGLQYLWSCMVLDNRIVFTTATSPGKDVTRGDHAGFLQVHSDPHAFDAVFRTMQPDFSSFHNEWGHGRMVLLPFQTRDGKPYCVGASIGIDHIQLLLRRSLHNSIAIGLITLGLGLVLSMAVSASLTQPIVNLTAVADRIRQGSTEHDFETEGSLEVRSLARSLASMRQAVQRTISALRVEIRERQHAQDELRGHRDRLGDLVRQRTAQLERSNRELEQFAYVASHDLQEPLRKIRAFGNLLASQCGEGLSEKGTDYVARMCSAAERMQSLIEDLLQLSRVSTRGRPFETVDLNKVMEVVLSDLAPRMAATNADVRVEPLPALDADPTQMHRLLQNLVVNGLKFHRQDVPPVVTVSSRTPQSVPPGNAFTGKQAENLCEIVVQDNGIGFKAQYADRIFQVFQRLHGQTEYEGSGIGLALCRRIVERHHGIITAQGHPGQGATFIATLPLRQPDEDNTSLSPASA